MTTDARKAYNTVDYKSLTEAEKAVFKTVIETLIERGTFNLVDCPVVASYARNVVLARIAAKDVERIGTVIEFKDRGYTKYKENPAIGVMAKAQIAFEATALKLGITPTGRKRTRAEEKPTLTELEKWERENGTDPS